MCRAQCSMSDSYFSSHGILESAYLDFSSLLRRGDVVLLALVMRARGASG